MKNIEDMIKNTNPKVPDRLAPDNVLSKTKKEKRFHAAYIALPVAACITALVVSTIIKPPTKSTIPSNTSVAYDYTGTTGKNKLEKKSSAYEKAYEMIKTQKYRGIKYATDTMNEVGLAGSISKNDLKTSSTSESTAGSYSKTNTRHENIDEGSLVKTDGTYIYAREYADGKDGYISVYKANNGNPDLITKITCDNNVRDIYLHGNTLITISNSSRNNLVPYYPNCKIGEESDNYTLVAFYDITSPSDIKLLDTASVEGNYNTTRIAGDNIYVITDYHSSFYYINIDDLEKTDYDKYIPTVNGKLVPEEDICIAPGCSYPEFTTIASINIDTREVSDMKSIMGYGDIYMSNTSIYHMSEYYAPNFNTIINEVLGTDFYEEYDKLSLIKIPYDEKGTFGEELVQKLRGSVKDDYSIDEYKDYIRLVTTAYSSTGSFTTLYVLDKDLDITGKIDDIARGELVKSARFMGDTGYFVTFRNTDPLFSVDLSDPANPTIIGELKIPGFSSYLHPIGDNLLLGVGMEYTESLKYLGIKLSVYDISDPTDVKEIKKTVFKNLDSATPIYDPNNFFYYEEKGLVGFGVTNYSALYYTGYMVFDIKSDEITTKYTTDFNTKYYNDMYGIYIDDYIYILPLDGTVKAIKISDL